MKKMNSAKKQGAFTLIELLVVIAVVAILAVLVWVLLDPMEQIRKAQDNAKLSNAKELAKGIERYAVSTFEYPWNRQNDAFTAAVRGADKMYYYDPTSGDGDMNWIWTLVDAEEVKEAGARSIYNSNAYYIFKGQGASGVYPWVCFEPASHMYMQKAAEACDVRRGKTNPDKFRTFDPCQTSDGTIADPKTTGMRNLICVTE